MSEASYIPPGWITTTLGEVVDVLRGVTYDKVHARSVAVPDLVPILRATNIGSTLTFDDLVYVPATYVRPDQYLKPGDVVVATSSGSLSVVGKGALVQQPVTASFGAFCSVLRPSCAVEPWYLAYFLQTAGYREAVSGLAAGVNINNLRRGHLEGLPLRLPPLAEQRRIVAALEEHLSDLDAAVAGLERAKVNVGRYQEALRDAAASGRLLGDADGGSCRQGAQIPAGWQWSTVGECAAPEPNAITDGPFGSKLKTEHYVDEGPRVIRLQNIGRGRFIDAKAHISTQHFATLQKHRVYAGDVVIAALGETLPRACVIPADVGPAIVKADCIRFKPDPAVLLSAYAGVALNADSTRRRVTAAIHGVGRPRLNLGEIREIAFMLPPLEVQRRIVESLESCFAVADRTAADIDVQLARASRLRHAVLKRAFEGKLVPQVSSDESASDLLASLRDSVTHATPHATRTHSAPKRATARRRSS